MATRPTAAVTKQMIAIQDAGDIDWLPHHRRRLAAIAGTTSCRDGDDRLAATTDRSPARAADTEF